MTKGRQLKHREMNFDSKVSSLRNHISSQERIIRGEYESGNSIPKSFMKQTVDSFKVNDKITKENTKYLKRDSANEIYQMQNQANS